MRITVIDDYLDIARNVPAFSKLAAHDVAIYNDSTQDIDQLASRLKETEALILIRERTPIGKDLLSRLDRLKIISQHGPIPHIDLDACSARGIVVSSGSSGVVSYATAELTWGLIIAAMRKFPQNISSAKAGKWQSQPGNGLHGKTLGVYGYGRLGSLIATYGKVFGMKTMVLARQASLKRAAADGHAAASTREDFFVGCDVISLHMRLVDATREIVTHSDLSRMKPAALFVNTSRAGLVEKGALERALRVGRPGMAALDVYDEEPIFDKNYPLFNMDNVICTPHMGFSEIGHYEAMFESIIDQILAFERGTPINVQNRSMVKPIGR